MRKLIRKLSGKLNIAIASVLAMLIVVGFGGIAYVLAASHTADQAASSSKATAISVRAQDYTTELSTITFPEGTPGTVISAPTNSAADTQVFGIAGTAKPVATLFQNSGGTYNIWYNITTFSNSVVASEDYVVQIKAAACADAGCITQSVTFDADTTTTATGDATAQTTIVSGAGNERDLYLKVTLSAIAGKSGTSVLTILGETP